MGKLWGWGSIFLLASSCIPSTIASTEDSSSIFTKTSNESLLWGPYRPNLYFGLRPRLPQNSLLTGLLWSRVEDYTSVQNQCRYTCEQNAGMEGYGWETYDPRTGGVQVIHDTENGIDLETSFVKFPGEEGGWGARVKGTVRKDARMLVGGNGKLKTAVWWAVSAEGLGNVLEVKGEDQGGFDGDVILEGSSPELGEYRMVVKEDQGNLHPQHQHPSWEGKPLDRTQVHSMQLPDEVLFQAKAMLFASLKETVDGYLEEYTQEKMPPPFQTYTIQHKPMTGNMQLLQKTFEGDFQFDVLFSPQSSSKPPTSEDLTNALTTTTESFNKKYLDIHPPQAPFSSPKYLEFSKSMFSNLLGGIGYFHGDQLIDRSYAPEYDEENEGFWREAEEARSRNLQKMEGPYELFTSIPSRPFFPRGFLWDEGFHLLPILDWDADLVMQILSSWFGTMDSDGWIPREQILGAEARTKVPVEFQVQYPHYANPPTLFMVLESLLDKLDAGKVENPEGVRKWLEGIYPLLKRNFEWYKRTQWGDLKTYEREARSKKEGYRWRGRTERHILTSGLDDYPRAQPPHPGELHVDLLSWMGLMGRNLKRVAGVVAEGEDVGKFTKIEQAILSNMDDLHWSPQHQTYCDSTIDEFEESVHVCHKGYISLFPFMTGLLAPKHPHLPAILDLIANKEELWSPHGIRSLSQKDEFYATEENYWRSPVWMNMNYLILRELYRIGGMAGPEQSRAAKIYGELRRNLVETVFESWRATGFAWEQYDPDTGKGQRTQHFTGWTSLVVKIMGMEEGVVVGGIVGGHDEL